MADTTHPPSSTLDYSAGGEGAHRRSGARGAAILSIILGLVIIALAVLLSKESGNTARARQDLAQANAEAAQVKNQLSSAQSQVTNLQAQLNNATQQQAALQSQITAARNRDAQLQTEVTRAQSALKAAQQQSQAQVADLQAQVRQNSSTVEGLRRDLEQANSQVNDLKAQVAAAKAAAAPPAAAAGGAAAVELRDLPLKSQFSKGFFSSKYSLELKNTSSAPVTVSIQAGSAEAKTATIKGGETYHVRDLAAGARVSVQGEGFNPMNLTAR